MNKLQKSAWRNLVGVTICVPVSIICHYLMARSNARGISYILIWLIVGSVGGLTMYLILRKKGLAAGFDEREKEISKRAFIWAANTLLVFLGCMCIIPFFALGGASDIPVFYLPVVFFCTLFVTQFAYSAAILIQFQLEAEDER